MKKWFMFASVIGLAIGVGYWLCKKDKPNNTVSESVDDKIVYESKSQEEDISQKSNIVEEMYQAKAENVQDVSARHSEAGEIMKGAYHNIMEDFVEDFSEVNVVKEKNENKKVVIDSESVSVMKEIDLISDELDDLLK